MITFNKYLLQDCTTPKVLWADFVYVHRIKKHIIFLKSTHFAPCVILSTIANVTINYANYLRTGIENYVSLPMRTHKIVDVPI